MKRKIFTVGIAGPAVLLMTEEHVVVRILVGMATIHPHLRIAGECGITEVKAGTPCIARSLLCSALSPCRSSVAAARHGSTIGGG